MEKLKPAELLNLADHCPLTLNAKFGSINFVAKHIHITTNYTPDEIYRKMTSEHAEALKRRVVWREY